MVRIQGGKGTPCGQSRSAGLTPILWDAAEAHTSVPHWALPRPQGAAAPKDTPSMWQPVMG